MSAVSIMVTPSSMARPIRASAAASVTWSALCP
jgi:hypothetical protein